MINLNHLKYFYDVCDSKSFTKSAKKNFISHSAISQAIKSLELSYGVTLMEHRKNFFELTEEGTVLFESIQLIFDSIKLSEIKLEKLKTEFSGNIKIGFSYSMAMNFMPDVLKNFKKKYPKIIPTIKLANSSKLAELIANRSVDVGIGIDDSALFKLESKLIKKGQFVLVSSKKEFREDDLFLIGDKGEEVIKFKQHYQKNRLKNQIVEIESWEVISRFAQSGMGIGLIPDFILESSFTNKLHIVDLGIKFPHYELKCFYREEKYLSRNTQAFLDQIAL
ncbi:MAG: LysR family transcriptional regulator [Bacteriovorax sp.]